MSKISKLFILSIFTLLMATLVACGSDDESESNASQDDQPEDTNSENEENESSEELEGSVVIDGSGTVYPLMSRMAEEYMINAQQGVSVEVSRSGTSAGFEKFLVEDGTDFNDASREIKDEEQAKADELGIDVKELKVALDGLSIVINPNNEFATELSEQQVIDIFLGEYTQWSDINSDWPEEKIQTYGPNENHGTYEFFYEEILDEQDLVEDINLQQDYSTLVTLVSEDENAIGFFGFGYYDNNQDKVQAVQVDFGDGPVAPSLETIGEEGPYANFTRPVFTYLNVNHAKEKPQVLDYSIWLMENVNDYAGEVGFAPIPDEEAQQLADELKELK
ncbi:PstS family phosphate ABC transporter substrate-binding protein [Aquisalibacillus elongatus]|uniref:Phosphate-binding protein n=1 Tax=Aquisalibacillus elongatus TaxID=485577 RepID=A0A3N5B8A8_9BACI|nr:PstS family phosphate ABC transporter substrate-binding protein [Aquisalibacillus elongatus]RPF53976.1 phosphate ABC transporter substrate-binding protein (PhoT family) [Aquisalibacillus elongatus]